MIRYAVLLNQGHNRVYFEASKKLAASELAIAARAFEARVGEPSAEEIGGVFYVVFDASERLNAGDLRVLSGLSFVYAIFELRVEGGLSLWPVCAERLGFFDNDLSMILKYTGKTNEIFTRLLINAAHYSSDFYSEQRLKLLDPVAGKGTTLFEGLRAGFDCSGVEISPDAARDGVTYLKKYLETARYKHTFHKERLSGENRSFTAEVNSFEIARDKESMRAGETLAFTLVAGDSRFTDKYFRKNSFHIMVGDLPYGVQHGNVSGQKQTALTRSPAELLRACLPTWVRCLKPGGAMAFAWNTFVFSRAAAEALLEEYGLCVLRGFPYDWLEHRVDQAIKRDVIVAVKKTTGNDVNG